MEFNEAIYKRKKIDEKPLTDILKELEFNQLGKRILGKPIYQEKQMDLFASSENEPESTTNLQDFNSIKADYKLIQTRDEHLNFINPIIGFHFFTSNGVLAFIANKTFKKQEIEKGSYKIVVNVPSNYLNTGEFYINLTCLDWIDTPNIIFEQDLSNLVKNKDIIITMLPNGKIVKEVWNSFINFIDWVG